MKRLLNPTAAILMAVVFLAAGIWKMSDPAGAAIRLHQAMVPDSLSLWTASALAVTETLAGIMLLVPRWRRWGGQLGSVLLIAFMAFIALHYAALQGADCSCFPWVKRAVGPGFFVTDALMLLLTAIAWWSAPRTASVRGALVLLVCIASVTGLSYRVNLASHTGTQAPPSITAEDGQTISLREGRVFIYFFDPQCLHCLEAGRRLAALNWGSTRFVGVPTQNPQFAGWFMGKAGLLGKGPVSRDLALLKKTFPFDLPPAGVALEDGYEKAMVLHFEDQEPRATLARLNFAR
ncbi:MAG: MauE/DoxX family redox-associated membrane protein [Terriglobia bacterium]